MNTDPFEILSAFVDGEATDPVELAGALASPGARETLIDFVRIRAAVAGDPAVPSARFYSAIDREMRRTVPHPRPWARRLAVGTLAAVLLATGILAGLAIRGGPGGAAKVEAPPAPARELRFTDGVDWFRS